MSARSGIAAAATAATLALAACGGDGEQEDKEQYAGTVNGFCSQVQNSVKRVQTDLQQAQSSAGNDVDKATEAVGGALTDFASSVDRSLGTLRGAEVPEDYRSFHDGAVRGLGRVVTVLRDAGAKAKDGDVSALSQLGTSLRDIKVPDPPEDLRKAAPSCQALSGSTSGG